MGIEIQPKGVAGLYAQAAKLVKQAEATRREEAKAERISSQLRSFAQQKEMAEFGAQLQLDREKRALTRGIEAEERAYQWQLEKAELASRMDFEKSERDRIRKLEQYEQALELIEESNLPDIPKAKAIFDVQMKMREVEFPARVLYPEAYKTAKPSLLEQYGLAEPSITSAVGRAAREQPVAPAAGTMIEMLHPRTGERWVVPAESQATAEIKGYQVVRVITPEAEPTGMEPSLWQKGTVAGALSYLLGRPRKEDEKPKKKPY